MAFWNSNNVKVAKEDLNNLFTAFNEMHVDRGKRLDEEVWKVFKSKSFLNPLPKYKALKLATVYGCTRVISGGIGQMPFVVKGQSETEAMLNNPNPLFSGSQFRTWAMQNVLLEGNAYAPIIRRGAAPAEIIPLDPAHYTVTPRLHKDRGIVYDIWRSSYQDSQEVAATIERENMLHFTSDTFDGLKGKSVLETGASAASNLESKLNEYAYLHFEKGALQDYMMSTPDAKHEDRVKKIQKDWEEKIAGGTDTKNKIIVVGRDVELKNLNASVRDSQMIQNREVTIQDIARAFGVLSFMIGQEQRVTSFAGVQEMTLFFLRYTLMPHIVRIEEELSRKLYSDGRAQVKLNTSVLIRATDKDRAIFVDVMRGGGGKPGIYSVNELRTIVEELDEIDEAPYTKPYVPGAVQMTPEDDQTLLDDEGNPQPVIVEDNSNNNDD